MIRIRRAYDTPGQEDGFRVLVDRLWPRGLAKDRAAIDLWLRDVAPTAALRRWFGHDHAKWHEFCRRYAKELEGKGDVLKFIRSKGRGGNITLLFGARDREFNNAVALQRILVSARGRSRTRRVAGSATLAQGAARRIDRVTRRGRPSKTRRVGRGDHGADPGRRS
jgi:uncharacterized protein YeaO (DUF488 family)